jgi:hypothetical protein
MCTEQGEVKRMIPITAISEIRRGKVSGRPQLLLVVPCDHDLLVTFYDDKNPTTAATCDDFIRVLQLIHKGWTSQLIPERVIEQDNKLVDGANLKKPPMYDNPKTRLAALEKMCADHTPPLMSLPKAQIAANTHTAAPPQVPKGGISAEGSPAMSPMSQAPPPPYQLMNQSPAAPPPPQYYENSPPTPPLLQPPPHYQQQQQHFQGPPEHNQRGGFQPNDSNLRSELEFYKSKAALLEAQNANQQGFHPSGMRPSAALVPAPDHTDEEINALRVQLDCERQALQRVRNSARSERILAQLVTAICYQNTKKHVSKFEQNYDELLKSKDVSLDMAYSRVTELENLLYRGAQSGGRAPTTPLPPPMCLGRTTVPQELPPQMHDVFKQYLSPNKVALLNQL